MDLNKIKPTTRKKTDSMNVKTIDRFPDKKVITLMEVEEGKRDNIQLNTTLFNELNMNDKVRMGYFSSYNISDTDEAEYVPVIAFFSADEKEVQGPSKKHKTYAISNNRNLYSKQIYKGLTETLELDNTVKNDVELIELDNNVYTFKLIDKDFEENVQVDVDFNKGEEVEVEAK